MIFKRKEKFFLTIDETPSAPAIPAAPAPTKPEVAPEPTTAAPKTPKAPSKPTPSKAKGKVQDTSEIIAAAVQAAPSPVTKATPAPRVETPYEYFPSRRRPGPSLQGFMDMARSMGRS
jgi:hypothetical protein